ncbi:hypothetical protein QYF36_016026 [Acer negundo]|nr:hypothetical protein QYF36_016026 [Acer negundo]
MQTTRREVLSLLEVINTPLFIELPSHYFTTSYSLPNLRRLDNYEVLLSLNVEDKELIEEKLVFQVILISEYGTILSDIKSKMINVLLKADFNYGTESKDVVRNANETNNVQMSSATTSRTSLGAAESINIIS